MADSSTKNTKRGKYSFTMKYMKGVKISGRVNRPGRPALGISPLATNASPLDHARRAAGGELGETMFCLQGKPGQFQVPPCIPPPELF